MASLRLLLQILWSFDGKGEQGSQQDSALDLYLNNPNLNHVLQQAVHTSKVPAIQAGAMQCQANLIKQILEDGNLDPAILVVDFQKILPLFESNSQSEPIISAAACGLINEMLNQDQNQAAAILQKFSQANTLQTLRNLIDHKITLQGNMSLINGINYGCPYQGFYDPFVVLLQNLFQHSLDSPQLRPQVLNAIQKVKLGEQVIEFLMAINSKSDISPNGFTRVL